MKTNIFLKAGSLIAFVLASSLHILEAGAQSSRLPGATENPSKSDKWLLPEFRFDDVPHPKAKNHSYSTGTVSDGRLYNSRRIELPRQHIHILSQQRQRDLNFTAARLIDAIRAGASFVASKEPNKTTYLGNASYKFGGDIPYSVSHDSGRDIDVAFFYEDAKGRQYIPGDLIRLRPNGRPLSGKPKIQFDISANWWFIEGLVRQSDASVEFIFISKDLKQELMAFAKEKGRPPDVIDKARHLLHQPSRAPPHSDHFHIRIFCSHADIEVGCRDIGQKNKRPSKRAKIKANAIDRAIDRLDRQTTPPSQKVDALRQLHHLRAEEALPQIKRRLASESRALRIFAIRAIASLTDDPAPLLKQLQTETDPYVTAELLTMLADFELSDIETSLRRQLVAPRDLTFSPGFETNSYQFVAEVLIQKSARSFIGPLVRTLQTIKHVERAQPIIRALRHLANRKQLSNGQINRNQLSTIKHAWLKWHAEESNLSTEELLIAGFQSEGYDIQRLSLTESLSLCRAISGPDYISRNAQKVLMKLSEHRPNSLQWPKKAARHYWTRWVVRETQRFLFPRNWYIVEACLEC